MIIRLLLLRAAGFALIISGLIMVFTQIPLILKRVVEKHLGAMKQRRSK